MGLATIQAHRTIQLRIDPEAITFEYNLVTHTDSTYGGKVIQILSANIQNLSIPCMAGSGGREYLKDVFTFYKEMLFWQRDTKNVARFTYPPRKYDLLVYALSFQFQDATENVTFPFTMAFNVNTDAGGYGPVGGAQKQIIEAEMAKLIDGIGYTKNMFNDPEKSTATDKNKATDPNGGEGGADTGSTTGTQPSGNAPDSEAKPTGQIFYNGNNPRLDTDGINPPPFNDPNHQNQTSLPNLDANVTAYVVVNTKDQLNKKFLIQNHTTKKSVIAIGGDIGHGFGEISLKAAQDLGMNITGNTMPAHSITISAYG